MPACFCVTAFGNDANFELRCDVQWKQSGGIYTLINRNV